MLSLEYMAAVRRWAAAQSPPLPVHLDGARVFNAATSLGTPPRMLPTAALLHQDRLPLEPR